MHNKFQIRVPFCEVLTNIGIYINCGQNFNRSVFNLLEL